MVDGPIYERIFKAQLGVKSGYSPDGVFVLQLAAKGVGYIQNFRK